MGAGLIKYRNGSKVGSSLSPKNALVARNAHDSSSKLVIYRNGVRNSPSLSSKQPRGSTAGSPKAAISSSNKATSLGVVRDKAFSKKTVYIEPNENRGEETESLKIATEEAKRSSVIRNFTQEENKLMCCVAEGNRGSLEFASDNAKECTNNNLVLDIAQEKATKETTDDEKFHPEDARFALDVVDGTNEVKGKATKETTDNETLQLDDARLALDVVEGTKEGLRIAFGDAKMELKKLISEGNHWILGTFCR
mmetsp:Transcript_9417/g.13641  ORF Transcript_9417/g.13641 Transcript_9417/m.13641 type:complete len:252 (+) Transcript_9417:261-1016(+)|eukprot:CAMPEP_0172426880 /NCGR_PEP_ID=MMETSP1064-20121228/39474_1 /TAXON_ID=202472 /ORGANISM="Aulacoseira subarctica , Strain CCAP 1002/5" /LENGTH=251 /DNA_ID=CAMNT_0013170739 /DNA_START=243 /DNA_END=998 /DNA_ORIENTATION=-